MRVRNVTSAVERRSSTLGSEVVVDEMVGGPRRSDRALSSTSRLRRRERQQGRPALRSRDRHVAVLPAGAAPVRVPPDGLALVHGPAPSDRTPAMTRHPPASGRGGASVRACDGHLRPIGHVLDRLGEDVGHPRDVIRCASSMASPNGLWVGTCSGNRPTTVRCDTRPPRSRPRAPDRPTRRSIAAARSVRTRPGRCRCRQPSASDRPECSVAHWTRRRLAEAGGATIQMTGRSVADRIWRNSLVRRNVPTCRCGTTSLASRIGSVRPAALSPCARS